MVVGLALMLGAQGGAQGAERSVSINGVTLRPLIESKRLPSGREGLPVWFLPRLGVQTRNNPQDVWLSYGGRTLRYTAGHWSGVAGAGGLSAPEPYGSSGSLHVSLEVLRLLGVPLTGTANTLNVTVAQAARPTPVPAVPLLGVSVTSTPQPPKATALKSAAVKPVPVKPVPVKAVPTVAKPATKVPPTSSVQVTAGIKPQSVSALPPTTAPITVARAAVTPPALPPAAAPASDRLPSPSAQPPQASAQQPNPQQPSSQEPSPQVPIIGPRILEIRSSLTPVRNILAQRIVIDLTGPVQYSVERSSGQVSLFLLGASGQTVTQRMESGDVLSIVPSTNAAGRAGMSVRLQTVGAVGEVQTLQNPDRLVIDSATSQNDTVPPPVSESALPQGMSLRVLGSLSLLSFDPQYFTPRVVAAPTGSALSVAELVRRVGGLAGVNGGYFDPPSSLSVDFVTVAGQMLSSSLEKRAAVGFDPQGNVSFGYPRPRYFAEGRFGSVVVNSVSSRAQPNLLTAFVGDGRTVVGGPNLTTVLLGAGGVVTRSGLGGVVAPAGTMSLTFDAGRFPQLPRTVGERLSLRLDYQLAGWNNVREGLAAGPLLLQGGKVVLNPTREAFNVYTNIWRPTRQVAFALYQGRPTFAFLESGTPESFAAALARAGVSDALRLDSGSSATVFVAGGYLGNGGYLNTVWSRPVPNALVMVPK